jgi:hypothetical protein
MHDHKVQFYDTDRRALVGNVAAFLAEGLDRGEDVVIVATPEHRAAFIAELAKIGSNPYAAIETGRLIALDARETLDRFLVDGYPDAVRFESVIGVLVRGLMDRPDSLGLRAYGEMVGVLWKERNFPAAIRLEHLWNKLRKTHDFPLYCSYQVDVFDKHFCALDAVLCSHTHVAPFGENGNLEEAVSRAMDEVLADRLVESRLLADSRRHAERAALPKEHALILWLRSNVPDQADAILARAREYYQIPRSFCRR